MTALVELMKDCDPEEGICLLILETLAGVMSASSVDFTWLYTLGKLLECCYKHHLANKLTCGINLVNVAVSTISIFTNSLKLGKYSQQ